MNEFNGGDNDPFNEFPKQFNAHFTAAQKTARVGLYAAIGLGFGFLGLVAYAIHSFAH